MTEKRNKLIQDNMELVETLARIKRKAISSRIEFDDLLSEGYLALIEEAGNENFDEKISSFQTFASIRILGAMSDYVRHCHRWGKWMSYLDRMLSIEEVNQSDLYYYEDEIEDSFEELIHALPESGKYIMRLYYVHDFTYKEIAEKIGLSESGVSQKMQNLREMVRISLWK